MLVDANLLIYAVDERSPHHRASHRWLTSAMTGDRRVALPWLSLTAFVRITTNPRASDRPLAPVEAWGFVRDWLSCDLTWTPNPVLSTADEGPTTSPSATDNVPVEEIRNNPVGSHLK